MSVKRVFLLGLTLLLVACKGATDGTPAEPTAGLPNPASVNCAEQGGTLQIESRPDGGQFGVCFFDDNRQCEEWAMLRGDCPVGGLKVTGYITDAGRFCAISGGVYEATGTDAAGAEIGACTLPDSTTCEAQAYYEGTCPASSE